LASGSPEQREGIGFGEIGGIADIRRDCKSVGAFLESGPSTGCKIGFLLNAA